MAFEISDLKVGSGRLGLGPLPGADGDFAQDFARLTGWAPGLVISMTETEEMHRAGAAGLGAALAGAGIDWVHLPIRDFGAPDAGTGARWPEISPRVHALLDRGGRGLVHCRGGCGRWEERGVVLWKVWREATTGPEWRHRRIRGTEKKLGMREWEGSDAAAGERHGEWWEQQPHRQRHWHE